MKNKLNTSSKYLLTNKERNKADQKKIKIKRKCYHVYMGDRKEIACVQERKG